MKQVKEKMQNVLITITVTSKDFQNKLQDMLKTH
jgi:hypothetical protein